jgi:hypothetical protein
VPVLRDRAGERAGDRRRLRTLRQRGRASDHERVVLPDHGLPGPIDRGPGSDRHAGLHQADAAGVAGRAKGLVRLAAADMGMPNPDRGRDGYPGRVRGLLVLLPALPDRQRHRVPAGRLLPARRPVRRRGRARLHAPDLHPVHPHGAVRHGHRPSGGAVQEGDPPGRHQEARGQDVEVERETPSVPTTTIPTSCGCT